MKVLLRDDLIFRKANEAFQWCTQDRESRELALSRERFLRDQASNLSATMEEGIEKGSEQGINTVREETRIENARAMNIRGLDTELIMEVTGLDRESVDKLLVDRCGRSALDKAGGARRDRSHQGPGHDQSLSHWVLLYGAP